MRPPSNQPAGISEQPWPPQFAPGMPHPHPMQLPNLLLILINLGTLILSIPILVVGIWLAARHHSHCLGFLQWPLIVIGIVMMVVSVTGLVGALRRRALLLWVYMCFLSIIILVLLGFIILTFVVTRGSKGHITVQGENLKEYVLGDYSNWMRNKVSDAPTWDKIKRCLLSDRVCRNMDSKYPTQSIMYHSKLTYVESGCCKPPTACNFTFVTATNWVNPTTPGVHPDCARWSNDPLQLCYDCNSCKAGVIRTINNDWRKAAKVALAVLVALALLYVLALLAFAEALVNKSLDYTTAQYPYGVSRT